MTRPHERDETHQHHREDERERDAREADEPGNPATNDLEVARELASGPENAADLPPKPTQQGDGQETGTARPKRPSDETR